MLFDFFDMLGKFFSEFTTILDFFTQTRTTLDGIVVTVRNFDFINVISPYLGTIRYVAGDYVYLIFVRTLQIGMFLLLTKTMKQLVEIIVNSFIVQKPLSIIKGFMR